MAACAPASWQPTTQGGEGSEPIAEMRVGRDKVSVSMLAERRTDMGKNRSFVKTTLPVNQSCVGNKPRIRLARCLETGMSWNVSKCTGEY